GTGPASAFQTVAARPAAINAQTVFFIPLFITGRKQSTFLYCQFIAAGLREAPVVLVRNPAFKSTEIEVNEILPAAAQSYQLLFTGSR
ncbi:hypothetical protein, partial [Xanthomonas translucens]